MREDAGGCGRMREDAGGLACGVVLSWRRTMTPRRCPDPEHPCRMPVPRVEAIETLRGGCESATSSECCFATSVGPCQMARRGQEGLRDRAAFRVQGLRDSTWWVGGCCESAMLCQAPHPEPARRRVCSGSDSHEVNSSLPQEQFGIGLLGLGITAAVCPPSQSQPTPPGTSRRQPLARHAEGDAQIHATLGGAPPRRSGLNLHSTE